MSHEGNGQGSGGGDECEMGGYTAEQWKVLDAPYIIIPDTPEVMDFHHEQRHDTITQTAPPEPAQQAQQAQQPRANRTKCPLGRPFGPNGVPVHRSKSYCYTDILRETTMDEYECSLLADVPLCAECEKVPIEEMKPHIRKRGPFQKDVATKRCQEKHGIGAWNSV